MHQSQKSSNFYFDVKVPTSPSQFTQVRVMKQREDGSKRQLFIDKMESQQPVKLPTSLLHLLEHHSSIRDLLL